MENKQFFIILLLLPYNSCFVKEWTKFYSLENPESWNPEKIPCENDRVFFSKNLEFRLYIDTMISAKEIVLSENGALILTPNNGFIFGKNTNVDKNSFDKVCSGEDVRLKNITIQPWFGIDSWKIVDFGKEETKSGEGVNAIPHRDRGPCYNDELVFPSTKPFILSTPTIDTRYKKIKLGKFEMDPWMNIETFFYIHPENFYIKDEDVNIKISPYYDNGEVDVCQENIMDSDVCDSVLCPEPSNYCINPLKPQMNCCNICGGLITAEVNMDFDIRAFRKAIAHWIVTEKLKNDRSPIQWWVGPIKRYYGIKHRLQIIVLDREQYDGVSAAFVEDLKNFINKNYKSEVLITEVLNSGLPWNRNAGISGLWLVPITLLCVIAVFLGLSKFYYGPVSSNVETRPFGFARFENRSREGSIAFGISQLSLNKSFENPLYGSMTKSKEEFEVTEVSLNESDDESADRKSETAFE